MTRRNTIMMVALFLGLMAFACRNLEENSEPQMTQTEEHMAKDLFGNPNIQAISYGGYREHSRDIQPTVEQLKEDVKIMSALGIKMLRTYNTHYAHASNVLKAIRELKNEDPGFEFFVMLGAWIDCKDAWTDHPNHYAENEDANAAEIQRAVDLANAYPDIVKVIAVGNESMVKWAAAYYVQAGVILKYVNQLKALRQSGNLPPGLWITSSDNFASWGGGGTEYHTDDLKSLMEAVDFISMHTYPMHDTHYNPEFWGIAGTDHDLSLEEQVELAMDRSVAYAKKQYHQVIRYMESQGIEKPVHIGETGWASYSNELFGTEGTRACDEYKQALYHKGIREWTHAEGITCFYFQAFDEPWKDGNNPGGSENHFGLFTVDGRAKYAIWDQVDGGAFKGLTRGGQPITKTYGGDKEALKKDLMVPPVKAF